MLLNRALDLLFPPLCLHCSASLSSGKRLFCQGCSAFFELIDPTSRCPYCFALIHGRHPCSECIEKRRWSLQIASALDYLGAVATLVKRQKYGRLPYLAKTAAAFMITQWSHLEWPLPDLIVPVPRRLWFQGANHAQLLAEQMGKMLSVPVCPVVKRTIGDLSQARLGKKRREAQNLDFYLSRRANLLDQTILIVDDVMTTGTTLRHTAQALEAAIPRKLYALTLARSTHP